MESKRAAVVAFAIAAPLVLAAIVAGCDQGTPAEPTAQPFTTPTYEVCPKLDPTFDSIRLNLLGTDTCGSGRSACHSPTGVGALNYQAGAADLYVSLVGDAGTGHIALNQNAASGAPPEYRVIPGDADASALYVKVTLPAGPPDPNFGSGMPFDHPGSLCQLDTDAIKTWIDDGAKFEEDGATPFPATDAGEETDAADASSDAGDAAD